MDPLFNITLPLKKNWDPIENYIVLTTNTDNAELRICIKAQNV